MKRNKPSATALFVANGIYYGIHMASLKEEVPEDLKRYTVKLIDHTYRIRSRFSRYRHLLYCAMLQALSVKGFFLHFLLRKKCIEKLVRDAIEQGFEQVIMLGAGWRAVQAIGKHPVRYSRLCRLSPAVTAAKHRRWSHSNVPALSA